MNSEGPKIFLPLVLVFIIFNGMVLIFKAFLENNGFDRDFVMVANLLLFILSIAGFFLQRKGIRSNNAHAFIRGVYSAILVKLFVCIIAVTAYAFIKTKNINKPALFLSMGMYAVYTSIEVAALMKVARKKSNV